METAPLVDRADEADAARPGRRRQIGLVVLSLVAVSAVTMHLAAGRTGADAAPSDAPRTASLATAATAATAHVDAELSSTVGYSYSYLYECENGNPSVATAYANGSWGSIDGDWYVIAGNIPNSSSASGSCCRMTFEFPETTTMNQNMMYHRGDDYYMWNFTGNVEYDDEVGLWVNEGGDGTNTGMYSQFWSGVFLVGTYEGARWFGWYFCGPAVTVTQYGIPWILKETNDYDDGFVDHVKSKLDDLGLLTYGTFTTYHQGDSCDYTWHHTANEVE
jgi:hypothetical protein